MAKQQALSYLLIGAVMRRELLMRGAFDRGRLHSGFVDLTGHRSSYSNISSKTAKRLDGIAAGLVKCLGERAWEPLATVYTGIIQGDPIPADWLRSRVCLVSK
ncbi:hypothetical protein MRX96_024036 [Rhipicephalus microplus]